MNTQINVKNNFRKNQFSIEITGEQSEIDAFVKSIQTYITKKLINDKSTDLWVGKYLSWRDKMDPNNIKECFIEHLGKINDLTIGVNYLEVSIIDSTFKYTPESVKKIFFKE